VLEIHGWSGGCTWSLALLIAGKNTRVGTRRERAKSSGLRAGMQDGVFDPSLCNHLSRACARASTPKWAASVVRTTEHGSAMHADKEVKKAARSVRSGVQIDYDVVHLPTSLVQLFVLLQLDLEEVVQIIELRRSRGAPNGYPFAALSSLPPRLLATSTVLVRFNHG
jgi:hypothetical protein